MAARRKKKLTVITVGDVEIPTVRPGVSAPRPVMAKEPKVRLDQLLHRLGGRAAPKPINGRVVLPEIGKRTCAGQLELFDEERSED